MSASCPECGATIFATDAICPDCLKRVALSEAAEFDEAEASVLKDLVPESLQPKLGHNIVGGGVGAPDREQWGDYELLESIGRGAMGTVFKARHLRLNRLAALKLIRQGDQASEPQRKRFLREAEAVARLQHPHIVTLYETGEVKGQPYLAMEYLPGKTLAETIAHNPLPPRQAAECVKKISEAIHYAHEHGVLHRDLKPSNIALDSNSEPRVMDFGLARLVEQESEMTLTGMAIGSPSYMAPEQAAGKVREVSAASDVYALGAILYEALTARPPFQAESAIETMRQVMEREPVSPRLLNPSVPPDLETICLKCLEKQPFRRYTTATELADDLGRFLRNEPIRARPLGAPARLGRWCCRKPALALSLAAALMLMLLIGIGAPIAVLRISEARNRAEAAHKQEAALRVRAESAERQTEAQLYTALLGEARGLAHSGELGQRIKALDALRRAAAISNSMELRREVFTALALPDLRFERDFPIGPNVTAAQCDPAFERIAICRGRRGVEIRAMPDNRLLASLPARTNLMAYLVRWSSDGRYLAVKRDADAGSGLNVLEVWEVATGRRVLALEDLSREALSFHPRLPWLIVGQPGAVAIRHLESGQELKRFPFADLTIRQVEFDPAGENFAVLHYGPTQHVVTVSSTRNGVAALSRNFPDPISALTWQPDGKCMALADRAGRVQLLDVQTGETRLLGRHKLEAATLAFSPGGRYLFSGGWERELICWDMRTRQRAFIVGLDSYRLQFAADGRRCAMLTESTSTRGTFQNFSLNHFEQPAALREFPEDLGARLDTAAFSPDGRWMAASAIERAGVWDLSAPGPGALDDSGHEMRLGFNTDGSEMFGGRYKDRGDECLRWRLTPATNSTAPPGLMRLPLRKPDGFNFLAMRSNTIVITGDRGSQLLEPEEFETGSDRWVRTSPGLNGVSPDGQWLAIFRPWGEILYIYRLPGLEAVATLTTGSSIADFKFSPLGDEVAVCCTAGVGFWNTVTWQRTRFATNAKRLLYTPDARTLWLSADVRTGGLYAPQTFELLLPLPSGSIPLALSPDGRWLAVSVDLRRLQLWDLAAVRGQLQELGLDWPERQSKGTNNSSRTSAR